MPIAKREGETATDIEVGGYRYPNVCEPGENRRGAGTMRNVRLGGLI